MTFNNTDLYCQIFGSIMKDPSVLSSLPMPIVIDDFSQENQISRVIYFSLSNLVDNGTVVINAVTIETYLQDYPSLLQTYNRNNGRQFVLMCLEKGQPENFPVFYNRLKKLSLLRDLKEHGYDISPYDFESDNAGRIIWYETAKRISTDYPLEIKDVEYTQEGIQSIIEQIIAQFKHLVEDNSLYKLFYNDNKTRKREDAIQLLFYGIADKYCKDNNIDCSREINNGRGPIDFKFSKG